MNILIVGGNGYVGRHLAVRLKRLGHRVSIVDNRDIQGPSAVGYSIHIGDYGNTSFLNDVLKNEHVELVIHACGRSRVEESTASPMLYYINNVVGGVFFMKTLLENNIKKIVYISSAAVFGEQSKLPITATSIRNPISPLGHAQMLFESQLEAFRLTHGISYAIMRAANLAGLSEQEEQCFIENLGDGLIPSIIEYGLNKRDHVDIYGTSYGTIDGTGVRDYLHVDDFCDACINVFPHLDVRREKQIFNVGLGKGYSVKEVLACAENIIGKKIAIKELPEREGDPSRVYFDAFPVRTMLDWQPKCESLEDIINSVWKKFKLSNEK